MTAMGILKRQCISFIPCLWDAQIEVVQGYSGIWKNKSRNHTDSQCEGGDSDLHRQAQGLWSFGQ